MVIDKKKAVAGYVLSELKSEPIKDLAQLSRSAAAEGIVLLKNNNSVLPFNKNARVSVFGRIQTTYYKSGTGSGGLVNVEYTTNILDSLRAKSSIQINEKLAEIYENWIKENPFDIGKGWGQEPWCQTEMPLDDKTVLEAADFSDTALVVIGRTAGEDKDNSEKEGSYLLTSEEREMLKKVSSAFKYVCVVVNAGNLIDNNFVEEYDIDALVYVWQGGQEGGNAAADVLCGDITPSGKLSDTALQNVTDCPANDNFGNLPQVFYEEDIYVGYRYFETVAKEKVKYPFGFGLSYTSFDVKTTAANENDGVVSITVDVTNTGNVVGKEVVQVYYEAEQGKLGKPSRQLVAFAKTKLLSPQEKQILEIKFAVSSMASYDDSGVTGHKACYLLESGDYNVYVGTDVRNATQVFCYKVAEITIVKKLSEALAPVTSFKRMHPARQADGSLKMVYEQTPTRSEDLYKRIVDKRPQTIEYTGDKGIKLLDVCDGRATMQEFIAQLSDEQLACLVRGEGMSSPKVTPGTGSAFGGVTDELLDFGIPIVCTTDGPSGIRMDGGGKATSMPNGTLLACTWNPELVEELYTLEGVEMYAYNIDALLGPGMNIHRHPLNGRNFEYFSEDPYLTGVMASAISRGISKCGTTATIKHFIANNQEIGRSTSDSIISERAIREIYLKAFEMAVKQGNATAVMTTYNPLNGIWNAGNYDLCTTVLRDEWGYKGIVMTDWWAKVNEEGGPASITNLKPMVRAQNDLYMVCSDAATNHDNILEGLKEGFITRGELQRNCENICSYIINSPAFEKYVAAGCEKPKVHVKDEADMTTVYIAENIQSGDKVNIRFDSHANYLFKLTLASPADALAQMSINVCISNMANQVFSMNGTLGAEVIKSRLVEIAKGEHEVYCSFDKNVYIKKIEIKI